MDYSQLPCLVLRPHGLVQRGLHNWVRRTLNAKFQGLIYMKISSQHPGKLSYWQFRCKYKVVPSRSCLQETCCWARAQPKPRLLGFVDEYLDLYCDIP